MYGWMNAWSSPKFSLLSTNVTWRLGFCMNKSNLGLPFFEEKKSNIITKKVCLVDLCYVPVIISVDNQDQMDSSP